MSNYDLNMVVLEGHIGNTPEKRYTKDGTSMTFLALYTNSNWTDKNGTKHEESELHNVSVFGKPAEACVEYLHSGSAVRVIGSVHYDRHEETVKVEDVEQAVFNGVALKINGEPLLVKFVRTIKYWTCDVYINADRVDFLDRKPTNGNGNGHVTTTTGTPVTTFADTTINPDGTVNISQN